MKLTKAQIGRCGELLVQQQLLMYGIESAPMTTDTGVDLVAYSTRQADAVTIQVKSKWKPKPGGGKGKKALDWWIVPTHVGLIERSLHNPSLKDCKAIAPALALPLAQMIAEAEQLSRKKSNQRTRLAIAPAGVTQPLGLGLLVFICFAAPFQGFHVILRHALAFGVTVAQSKLTKGVILLGCFAEPLDRLHVIRGHAYAIGVEVAQPALSIGIPLFRHCFLLLKHWVPIHIAKIDGLQWLAG